MRKTTGPFNVDNEFEDYDPINNPEGTVIDANWANDVQQDLIAVQAEGGYPESPGTAGNVKNSIVRMIIENSKQIGELFYLSDERDPTPFDANNPRDYFPAVRIRPIIGTVDPYILLSHLDWPQLVPALRDMTPYSETAPVFFTGNGSPELVIDFSISANQYFAAIAEDIAIHGPLGINDDYRTMTIQTNTALYPFLNDQYQIINVDMAAETATLRGLINKDPISDADVLTMTLYPYRVFNSTETAAIYPIHRNAGLLTYTSGIGVSPRGPAGLRTRATAQDAMGQMSINIPNSGGSNAEGVFSETILLPNSPNIQTTGTANNDALNLIDFKLSNSVRTSTDGHGAGLFAHLYMWGREYIGT